MAHTVVVDVLIERLLATLIEILTKIGAVSAQPYCEFGKSELGVEIDLALLKTFFQPFAKRRH